MKPKAQRPRKVDNLGLEINAEWSDGTRTPAWDRLWKFILGDLDPEPVRPDTQQRGRGGDRG